LCRARRSTVGIGVATRQVGSGEAEIHERCTERRAIARVTNVVGRPLGMKRVVDGIMRLSVLAPWKFGSLTQR
jgi:hypothetical protein